MGVAQWSAAAGGERVAGREGRQSVTRIAGFSPALQTWSGLHLAAGAGNAGLARRSYFLFDGSQMSTRMALFKKKTDPLSERARALSSEIAALEAQIKQLDTRLQQPQTRPRLRSTARPRGPAVPAAPAPPREPVFEQVDHDRVNSQTDPETSKAHCNE